MRMINPAAFSCWQSNYPITKELSCAQYLTTSSLRSQPWTRLEAPRSMSASRWIHRSSYPLLQGQPLWLASYQWRCRPHRPTVSHCKTVGCSAAMCLWRRGKISPTGSNHWGSHGWHTHVSIDVDISPVGQKKAADETENERWIPGYFSPYWQLWKYVLISLSIGCNCVGGETQKLISTHSWGNQWLNWAMTLCQPAVLALRVMMSYICGYWWLSHALCCLTNDTQSWYSVNVYIDIIVTYYMISSALSCYLIKPTVPLQSYH